MTAIVGILNKHAISVAADSAVTIGGGRKIYNTANKIFTLSKYHPVGIAIYSNACFNSTVPWEIVIKMYRGQLSDKSFATLKEYADDFFAFLEDFKQKYLTQEDINKSMIRDVYLFWSSEVCSVLSKSNPEKISPEDLPVLMNRLDEIHSLSVATDIVQELASITKEMFINSISSLLWILRRQIESAGGKYEDYRARLEDALFSAFTRKYYVNPNHTGLAFFGYGEEEIYPSLYRTIIYNTFVNKLYWVVDDYVQVDDSPKDAFICPMAQTDVMQTYIEGINPNIEQTFMASTQRAIENILSNLSCICKDDNPDLASKIANLDINPVMAEYSKGINQFKQNQIVKPLVETVSTMGKEDIAELAENLIYLTSLKRHITPNLESVGGPVDVAVISKGDGFIWIKRKHYFDPELNTCYFDKYLNK